MRVHPVKHLANALSLMKKYSLSASKRCVFAVLFFTTTLILSHAYAVTPSAAQLEQLKNMSPAEQKALAQAYGIDISSISSTTSNTQTLNTEAISTSRAPNSPNSHVSDSLNNRQDNQGAAIEEFSSAATDKPSLEEDRAAVAINEDLALFGYDLFDYGADSFTPSVDIPVPANYVLGPGDNLVVQLYGKENITHTLNISREGAILFPNIGPINMAGLSFDSAVNKINEIVSTQMIGVKSSVTMGALRSIRVFVLGEARRPGSYVVSSLSTMTNAIFASGGVTKIGSLRSIELKRNGKRISTLDLYDLLLHGNTKNDARLLPGDVLFIPPIGQTVGVSGEVKRPAIYELKSEKTVANAIDLAGGLMATAFLPASRIERITASGEKTLVNLDISNSKGRSFGLQDADVIQIYSTLDTMRDIVNIEGHVKRPGGFAWREGMRLTDIIQSADNLLPDPDIEIGLIQRERKLTRKIEILTFSPKKAFLNPGSPDDPKLNPRDKIILFDYTTNRADILYEIGEKLRVQASFDEQHQSVRVIGAVRFSGDYPKANDMTAQEAVLLAGGLTESALRTDAEITRYRLNELRERVVVHTIHDLSLEQPILSEGDTLRIRKVPFWEEQESVEVLGEVYHPGTYAILPGESLIDVIKRAGGLTPRAFPEGSIFSREHLRELEADRLTELKKEISKDIAATNIEQSSNNGDIDKEEAEVILDTFDQVAPLGRMVIDLPQILNSPGTHDFQLTGGDVIEIPRFKPSVTVLGEVQYTTSHFFDKKLDINDYLNRSGGLRGNADKDRIYVIKANGLVFTPKRSVWFKRGKNRISPGDTIIVPIDTKKVDSLTLWSSVTTIMYQAALGVAAIASL